MPKEMIVKARCSIQKGHFAIFFHQAAEQSWEAERTFQMSDERGTRGYFPRSIAGTLIGARYSGCPYCEDKNLFLCNNCGTLNCQGSARRERQVIYVSCANCGAGGSIEGEVKKLEGYADL
jgi:hypothetical protein